MNESLKLQDINVREHLKITFKKYIIITFIIGSLFLIPIQSIRALETNTYQIKATGHIKYSLSRLHTDGRYIKNAYGEIIVFTGPNWQELAWKHYFDDEVNHKVAMMKELGVNSVRIHLNVDRWNDPVGNPGYRQMMDDAVEALNAADIYCIPVMERKTQHMWSQEEQWNIIENQWDIVIDWLVEIADRYKSYSNVCGIDILGEGCWSLGGHTYEEAEAIWRSRILSSAQAIHAVDPSLLVLFHDIYSDTFKGYGGTRLVDNPFTEPNMVYCTQTWYHYMGPGSAWANNYRTGNFELAKEQLETWLVDNIFYAALDLNLPIYIKSTAAWIVDPNWDVQIQDQYDLCKKYGVGWNQDEWHKLTDMALVESDWETLSPQGEIFAENL